MSGNKHETYLGDGVYAVFDGWNIVLDLRAQGPDKICLEPEVLAALFLFAKQLGWKSPEGSGSKP
jgi:hypothetical protein